jgi:hypothetical protein
MDERSIHNFQQAFSYLQTEGVVIVPRMLKAFEYLSPEVVMFIQRQSLYLEIH